MNRFLFYFSLCCLLLGCSEQEHVDLIIHNATIYTVDDAFSKAEAVAIKDGKIVEVGAEHQIMNAYVAKEVVDARQGFLYPGLIDAHAHILGYAIERQRLDLTGTKSFDEVLDRISDYIAKVNSKWVQGRGWDQNDWEAKEFPTNDTLSTLFPDHYVALKRVDGHAYFVSDNVLQLAGIDGTTTVEGGKIILSNGKPTGVLIDGAMQLVKDITPKPDKEFKSTALLNAQQKCFEAGLTSVCDAGLDVEDVALIDSLHQHGLKIRVYAMYSAAPELMDNMAQYSIQTNRLTAKSIKVYADGALGSRGAKLLQPYVDDTLNSGLMITPSDSIRQWAEACFKAGFQLNVHCIGDGANRATLDVMGDVLKGTNDRRWRIEHAQVVHPDDRAKFGQFTILPSMQPTHATSDMYWAEKRLGADRISHAYALRSLMLQNGMIPLGTDFPVENISPIATFFAATVRRDGEGFPPGGFNSEEKLSREEALRGMTIWAAVANFEEASRGSIEVGKFADVVLMDRDLMKCDENEILGTKILRTWLNGELVHEQ
ncbi:MAG: amidohydrolase [Cryomorphaceae bacterium]